MCESYIVFRLVKEDPYKYWKFIAECTFLELMEIHILRRTMYYLETEKPYFKKDDDD